MTPVSSAESIFRFFRGVKTIGGIFSFSGIRRTSDELVP